MLTKEVLQTLKKQGRSNAEIADMYTNAKTGNPLSREWVRRLCDKWGVGSVCKCGGELVGSQRRCDKCRQDAKKALYERVKEEHRQPRDFSNRGVVDEAMAVFEEEGLDVEYNVLGANGSAELLVEGRQVKCNRLIPVSKGHQTRVRPIEGADLFYLSDGETWFLIPAVEIQKQYNYIGESNPLRKWADDKYKGIVMEMLRG